MAPSTYLHSFVLFIALLNSSVIAQSRVPYNKTFRFVNQGEFEGLNVEYWASYRYIETNENMVLNWPFGLLFYNTTPNAHVLGIGANLPNDQSDTLWVWDANRNDPVRENSTLTFGCDGNLVLADVDGRIVWQTNTTNKGVTGISMQPDGNLVLHDNDGRFVWKSFDYPSDTLMKGQSLGLNGGKKLVSRTSNRDSYDGPYSMLVDRNGFIMYRNNSGALSEYAGWEATGLSNVTFNSVHEDQHTTTYFLNFGLRTASRHLLQTQPVSVSRRVVLKKIDYNYDYSFLRLESDGNLRGYTFYVEYGYSVWAKDYAYFGDTCPPNGSSRCVIST
ncbi:hypothetical protein MKW94_009721 [Papaver nudicaule]|uniref:Bulb-type lectin domain-containing protein n=1 Tax=Papaver nudicaule TaxID=74823 RepID=A0AA42B4Y4_PAPNU|nr:hypothetical protein [Papaver nudicaule]